MQSAALSSHSLANARAAFIRVALLGFHWWLGELRSMAPPSLLAYIDRARAPAAWLTMCQHGLFATQTDDGTPIVIAGDSELPASFLALAKNGMMPVRLHHRLAFQTTVEFPAAAEPNLPRILDHHIGLLVPLNPEDTVFRFALTSRDHVRNMIHIEIAIIKRQTLSLLQDRCQRLGISPESLRLEEGTSVTKAFDFLVKDTRPKARQYQQATRLLNITAALLALLLVAAIKWNQIEERAQLDRTITALAGTTEKANSVMEELARLQRTSIYINRKLNKVPRFALLNELATRLPDSSWLSDFRIADDELTMSGNAAGATTLVKALEMSPLLSNPHFVAPIYGWRDGTEHFEMAVHISEQSLRQ